MPYKNSGNKRPNENESQRQKHNLTVCNSNTNTANNNAQSNERSPMRDDSTRVKNNRTPRYNNKNVRLVKSKNQIVEQHKKSVHYNERSRQRKLSGLRSNIKTRSSHNPKLTANSHAGKYTQDALQNYSLTNKSCSISKESANVSISTICKGLDGNKISKKKHNDQTQHGESFEIYSKQNKIKMNFQGNKKYYLSKFNSKICPITIIQAPITVNGESAVNVHQSIVLSNKRGNQIPLNKVPESVKVTSVNKEIDVSLLNKRPKFNAIVSKRVNKETVFNPYSKKFCIKRKQGRRLGINLNVYQNDHSANTRDLGLSDYAVFSSFNKKRSTDLTKPVQLHNLSVNSSMNKATQMKAKIRKASGSGSKQR